MSRLVRFSITRAEVQQLLSYVNHRDQGSDSGWYYEPKKDFERRHASLKEILERSLLVESSAEGKSEVRK